MATDCENQTSKQKQKQCPLMFQTDFCGDGTTQTPIMNQWYQHNAVKPTWNVCTVTVLQSTISHSHSLILSFDLIFDTFNFSKWQINGLVIYWPCKTRGKHAIWLILIIHYYFFPRELLLFFFATTFTEFKWQIW